MRRWWLVPAAAFLTGTALYWPSTLWFRDEAGYVGQARLLLAGRLRPDATTVLHAWSTPAGPIAEYPFTFPALLALPFAVAPRAVFAVALASALILGWAASRKLGGWGRESGWGFAVLLAPVVLLFSRTAMVDVPLAAAGVIAWIAVGRGGMGFKAAAFATLVLLKPTGLVVGAGLILGEFLARVTGANAQSRWRVVRELAPAAAGAAVGLAIHLALNRAATGALQFGYAHSPMEFAWSNLPRTGMAHLKTLAFVPPGLVLGALPLWRRREYGALLAAGFLIVTMSFFTFVDSGRTAFETFVVAPRIILPAFVLLLVGWIDLIAGGVEAIIPRKIVPWTIAASLLIATMATGAVLQPRERGRREALAAAEAALSDRRGRLLGLGDAAFETGLLAEAPVVWAAPGAFAADVVLCADETESLRAAERSHSCELPGYGVLSRVGSYRVLVREGAPPP